MFDEYAELRAAVESHGYFTTEREDNVVCASKQYTEGPRAGGFYGKSFWVAKRSDGWYVGTWGPRLYRLADPGRVTEICLELLQGEGGAIWRLDETACDKFGLREIPEDSLPEL